MRTVFPQPLTPEGFALYGRYLCLAGRNISDLKPPIGESLHLGITKVKGGGDFIARKMERHVLGEEVLLCADDDMVLTLAAGDPEGAPASGDVACFYMRPGDMVVLNKGIWHDANRGAKRDTLYYFFAQDTTGLPGRERETEWVAIAPEPVAVCLGRELTHDAMAPYGEWVPVLEREGFGGVGDWTGWFMPGLCTDTPPVFGYRSLPQNGECTLWQSDAPVLVLGGACPLALVLAKGLSAPGQRDVERFLLPPGSYVKLNAGVWHGVLGAGYNYVAAENSGWNSAEMKIDTLQE